VVHVKLNNMTTKDWIYDLYVKEIAKSTPKVVKNINQTDIKNLPQTNKNGKSKKDC
jgi:hypothetical protein